MYSMKKIIWWCVAGGFILSGVLFWYISDEPLNFASNINAKQTSVEIEKDTILLGTVKYNEKRNIAFRVKNTGESPLIIRDVHPSCGCTSASWDKRPVKPGALTEISLKFEPNSLGRFVKSVDIICNIPEQVRQVKIMGQVEKN